MKVNSKGELYLYSKSLDTFKNFNLAYNGNKRESTTITTFKKCNENCNSEKEIIKNELNVKTSIIDSSDTEIFSVESNIIEGEYKYITSIYIDTGLDWNGIETKYSTNDDRISTIVKKDNVELLNCSGIIKDKTYKCAYDGEFKNVTEDELLSINEDLDKFFKSGSKYNNEYSQVLTDAFLYRVRDSGLY